MLYTGELIRIFRDKNFRPKKSLGQNFLIDRNIQQKILSHCHLSNEDIVLEIGAGLGVLTEELCRRVKFVYAMEKDRLLYELLRENLKPFGNLEIINKDILKFPLRLTSCTLSLKLKVIGNLPYCIVSPILAYLIENRRFIDSIYITLQKELAYRIMAKPGSREYGAFTIFLNYYTNPCIIFPIKRTCFYPQPDVDSCFMQLKMLEKPRVETGNERLFFEIMRAAFQNRRKTILNSLSRNSATGFSKEELSRILERAGIRPDRRPQTLGIDEFGRLTEVWDKKPIRRKGGNKCTE